MTMKTIAIFLAISINLNLIKGDLSEIHFDNSSVVLRGIDEQLLNTPGIKCPGVFIRSTGDQLFALRSSIVYRIDHRSGLKQFTIISDDDIQFSNCINDFQIAIWGKLVIMIVSRDRSIQIYAINKAEQPDYRSVPSIQTINVEGDLKMVKIFQPNGFDLFLLTIFSAQNHPVIVYKWHKSFFNRFKIENSSELLEIIDCRTIDSLIVCLDESGTLQIRDISRRTLNQSIKSNLSGKLNFHLIKLENGPAGILCNERCCSIYRLTDDFESTDCSYRDFVQLKFIGEWIGGLDTKGIVSVWNSIERMTVNLTDISDFFFVDSNGIVIVLKDGNYSIKFGRIIHRPDQEQIQSIHSESICSLKLQRSLELRRQYFNEIAKKISDSLLNKSSNLSVIEVPGKITAETGNFQTVQVQKNSKLKIKPSHLMKIIESMKFRIEKLKIKLNGQIKREPKPALSIRNLNVNRIKLSHHLAGKFNNILRLSEPKNLTGKITVSNLTVNELKIPLTDHLVGDPSTKTSQIVNEDIVRLDSIRFNQINGLNWPQFYESLFRKDGDGLLNGSIVLKQPSLLRSLSAEMFNNRLPITSLMTISTDQRVTSNIVIANFHGNEIEANWINGMSYQSDNVATVKGENLINSSIQIHFMDVSGTLRLADDDKFEQATPIIGTRPIDLTQIYGGKVIIRGSVVIGKVIAPFPIQLTAYPGEAPELNGTKWWKKAENQNINSLKLSSSIWKVPQMLCDQLNDHPIADYLMNSNDRPVVVSAIIDRAEINGHLFLPNSYQSTLSTISSGIVRRRQRTTIIGTIRMDHLAADQVITSASHLDSIVRRSLNGNIPLNGFNRLTIIGSLIQPTFNSIFTCQRYDRFVLTDVFKAFLQIDQPQTIGKRSVKLTGKSEIGKMQVKMIDGLDFNLLIDRIERLTMKVMKIRSNLALSRVEIKRINKISIDDYFRSVVRIDQTDVTVDGIKIFADLNTTHLTVNQINDINIDYWVDRSLNYDRKQSIFNLWIVQNLIVDRFFADRINVFEVNEIFIKGTDSNIRSPIKMNRSTIKRSIMGTINDWWRIHRLFTELKFDFPTRFWSNFDLTNVRIASNDQSIQNIIKFGITINGKQRIDAKTNFPNHSIFKRLLNHRSFEPIDNLIDQFIFKSTINPSTIQIDRSNLNRIICQCCWSTNNLNVKLINEIPVFNLFRSINRINSDCFDCLTIITGRKQFNNQLIVGHLITNGRINDIPIDDIYFMNQDRLLKQLIHQGRVIVNQINVTICNDLSFDFFLMNRIRLVGDPQTITGVLTFEHLQLNGTVRADSINGLRFDDLIFIESNDHQTMNDHKTFGDIYLFGPFSLTTLNDRELIRYFTDTVQLREVDNLETVPIKRLTFSDSVQLDHGFTIGRYLPVNITDVSTDNLFLPVRQKIKEIESSN